MNTTSKTFARSRCGALAVICSAMVMLLATDAMARPAHHPDLPDRNVGSVERLVIAKRTCERQRGPAHRGNVIRQTCRPTGTRLSANRAYSISN